MRAVEVNIIFEHEREIASAPIGLALMAIARAAYETNKRSIARLEGSKYQKSQKRAQDFLRDHANNLVWISSIDQKGDVEKKSTKVSTKVICVVGGIILGGLGGFGGDVIEESDTYKDAVIWTAEQVDEFVNDIRDVLDEAFREYSPQESGEWQFKIDEQRLIVELKPGGLFRNSPFDI